VIGGPVLRGLGEQTRDMGDNTLIASDAGSRPGIGASGDCPNERID
jgi:hypothetical protein